eukprot:jgi/Mesvir1/12846/Mv05878-RA.1
MTIRDPIIAFLALAAKIALAAVLESSVVDSLFVDWQRNDPSISRPAKDDTVTPAMLFVTVTFIFPGYAIIIEVLRRLVARGNKHRGTTLGPFWWLLTAYWITLLFCDILTSILKLTFGRLRPSFIAACKPDYTLLPAELRDDPSAWITFNICTADEWDVMQARRSFPSGHASSSSCGAFFVAWFLEATFRSSSAKSVTRASLCSWFQMVPLGVACFFAGSRYSDNKHHLGDLISGFVIGGVIATALFHSLIAPVQRKWAEGMGGKSDPAAPAPDGTYGAVSGTVVRPVGGPTYGQVGGPAYGQLGGPTIYTV